MKPCTLVVKTYQGPSDSTILLQEDHEAEVCKAHCLLTRSKGKARKARRDSREAIGSAKLKCGGEAIR
jgi:hypothetical protein